VLAKFEQRYCRARQHWVREIIITWKDEVGIERRMSNVGNNRGNWRNSEVGVDRIMVEMIIGVTIRNNRQGNQWFESRNRFRNDDRRFNDRGYRI
ncbi:hypothetical protein TNCV_2031941, partial [Trichonephila clavipes]